jgi:(2Fe-2S) ferredoxin
LVVFAFHVVIQKSDNKLVEGQVQLGKLSKITHQILVCEHKTCAKQGAVQSLDALKHALKQHQLQHDVMITKVDCLDQCGRGPVMVIHPEGAWYGAVDKRCARKLVERVIIKRKRIKGATLLHQIPIFD